jgi:hypothetical protein
VTPGPEAQHLVSIAADQTLGLGAVRYPLVIGEELGVQIHGHWSVHMRDGDRRAVACSSEGRID